jgi:hypothetical protein
MTVAGVDESRRSCLELSDRRRKSVDWCQVDLERKPSGGCATIQQDERLSVLNIEGDRHLGISLINF